MTDNRWKQWWITDSGEYQIMDDRYLSMGNDRQYEMKTMMNDRQWRLSDTDKWQTMVNDIQWWMAGNRRWKQWWMTDNGEYQVMDDRH